MIVSVAPPKLRLETWDLKLQCRYWDLRLEVAISVLRLEIWGCSLGIETWGGRPGIETWDLKVIETSCYWDLRWRSQYLNLRLEVVETGTLFSKNTFFWREIPYKQFSKIYKRIPLFFCPVRPQVSSLNFLRLETWIVSVAPNGFRLETCDLRLGRPAFWSIPAWPSGNSVRMSLGIWFSSACTLFFLLVGSSRSVFLAQIHYQGIYS